MKHWIGEEGPELFIPRNQRCDRCDSSDLSTSDLPAGVRVVCFTCGWVMLKDKPE